MSELSLHSIGSIGGKTGEDTGNYVSFEAMFYVIWSAPRGKEQQLPIPILMKATVAVEENENPELVKSQLELYFNSNYYHDGYLMPYLENILGKKASNYETNEAWLKYLERLANIVATKMLTYNNERPRYCKELTMSLNKLQGFYEG